MNHGKKNGHFLLVLLVTLIWIECQGAWKGRQGQLPQTRIPTTNINRKLGPPSRRSIQPKLPSTEDQVEQAEYLETKYGPGPEGPEDFASGGIARMLGE